MINPFKYIINRNVPPLPVKDGAERFESKASKDREPAVGWCWKPKNEAKGTIFATHGFCWHCRDEEYQMLAEAFDLAFVAVDSRHHGESGNRWPTFGTAESWDLRGAMDEAERRGFPQPFIVMGHSLGAMGAQRAAVKDSRIKGCFLAEPPQSPWHAIGNTVWNVMPGLGKPFAVGAAIPGQMINLHYKWDIMNDGDVRRHAATANPPHRPLIYFIMGEKDEFGIDKTKAVYNEWYRDVEGVDGKGRFPDVEPAARKWFVTVPGLGHNELPQFPEWRACQESFLRRCLADVVSEMSDNIADENHDGEIKLDFGSDAVLYFDIGGSNIRSFFSGEPNAGAILGSLAQGHNLDIRSRTWEPADEGRKLANLIHQEASKHKLPPAYRVLISISGEVSSNGRNYKGHLLTKGVPASLAEAVEQSLGLAHGCVTLQNDAVAWAQGGKALLQHTKAWNLGGVGVLAVGTGVGFAVVTHSGVTGKELSKGYKFGALNKHANCWADIHVNFGSEYHEWLKKQKWTDEQKREDATARLHLVLPVLAKKHGIDTFLVGGGFAELFNEVDECPYKVEILNRDTLKYDPEFIPMIGLNL